MIAAQDLIGALRKKIEEAREALTSVDPNNAGHIGRAQGKFHGLKEALSVVEGAIEDDEKEIES